MEALFGIGHASIVKDFVEMGALATFFVLTLALLYKYFRGLMITRKEQGTGLPYYEANCIDLAGHDFFAKIDVTISHVIPNIKLASKEKEACLIDFMLIISRTFRDCFTRVVKESDALRHLSGEVWGRYMVEKLIDCLATGQDEARRIGIPEAFIAGFNDVQQAKIVQVTEMINLFSRSTFLTDNQTRLSAVLDTVQATFFAILFDAEKTMDAMNGEINAALKGYKRKVR
jgi:hypothetical protein